MKYVYILQSLGEPEHYYVGVASDLKDRLRRHNAGQISHTAKHLPWKLKTYIAFSEESRAFAMEKYLKSGSGRSFAKRHL